MKKLTIIATVAFTSAILLTSCENSKPQLPALKTETDSLNYALGVAYGDNLKTNYIKDSVDTKIKDLMEGIKEGSKGKVDKDNAELSELGARIGNSMKEMKKTGLMGDSSLTLNADLIKQGLINGMKGGKDQQMTFQAAQEYLQSTISKRQAVKMQKQYGNNKVAGEKFLAENAHKPGVVTTASGLQYQVISKGNGPLPKLTDKVKVNYHGTLVDGTVFDSSIQRKEPVVFPVGGVIKGWTEALLLMPVGSKYKVFVPQQLAYGDQERGPIKPYSALIFDVELISIEK